MKKLFALLLALMMVFALVACGAEEVAAPEDEVIVEDEVVEEEVAAEEEVADSAVTADISGADITQEELVALAAAYNEVAPLYNEAYTLAEENGWMADEQTAAEIEALNATLGVIGVGLTEDPTILDGTDFAALTETLAQFGPALEEMIARVSVPYEG